MRNLFIIGILLFGAFTAGWFKVNRDGDRTTIEINRNEIREDTREAIDRGREFLNERDLQQNALSVPQQAGSELWSRGSEIAQTGFWTGGANQTESQNYSVPQSTGSQPGSAQTWQQGTPTMNWQYQPAQEPQYQYQQPYTR